MHRHHWQDWTTCAIGLWLIVSPWLLPISATGIGGSYPAVGTFLVLGAVVLGLGTLALFEISVWKDWAGAALGLVLILSPWIFGFAGVDAALWNAVATGVLLAVISLWSHLLPHEGDHA